MKEDQNMTALAIAAAGHGTATRAPRWFAHLLGPIRAHLHARRNVIHEHMSRSLEYRMIYLDGDRDVCDTTICLDPACSAVQVTRAGERWPSLILEVGIVDRFTLLIGDRPPLVDVILAHVTASELD